MCSRRCMVLEQSLMAWQWCQCFYQMEGLDLYCEFYHDLSDFRCSAHYSYSCMVLVACQFTIGTIYSWVFFFFCGAIPIANSQVCNCLLRCHCQYLDMGGLTMVAQVVGDAVMMVARVVGDAVTMVAQVVRDSVMMVAAIVGMADIIPTKIMGFKELGNRGLFLLVCLPQPVQI